MEDHNDIDLHPHIRSTANEGVPLHRFSDDEHTPSYLGPVVGPVVGHFSGGQRVPSSYLRPVVGRFSSEEHGISPIHYTVQKEQMGQMEQPYTQEPLNHIPGRDFPHGIPYKDKNIRKQHMFMETDPTNTVHTDENEDDDVDEKEQSDEEIDDEDDVNNKQTNVNSKPRYLRNPKFQKPKLVSRISLLK